MCVQLTVHARHPYSLFACPGISRKPYYTKELAARKVSLVNSDYVLLQSSAMHHMHSHAGGTHNYLFDGGTSRFDSSIWWFFCAYAQRLVSFSQIFGWEYTLLEPVDFWEHAPPKLVSSYSSLVCCTS